MGLNKTIDRLTSANSVCSYGNAIKREDDSAFRKELELEVEGQRNEGRSNRTGGRWRIKAIRFV